MEITPNILVVDDDEGIRHFVSETLKYQGYRTCSANSGKEAVTECLNTTFDLVIVDIGLPDMDGIELLKQLKTEHPDLMVIMLTGVATVETTINALNTGASGYITKPVHMNGLTLHVKEALERRRLMKDNRRLVQELEKELSEKKKAEDELKKKNRELLIWTRELNCLYGVSHILERRDITLDELFQKLVEAISSYWPENEKICTRITYGEKSFATGNYRGIPATYSSDIVIGDEVVGRLELTYPDFQPRSDDAASMRNESELLNTIASRLGRIVEYKLSEEKKRELEAQLLQTEKMASIGQLAAGVAHEINNPTGFVISNLNTFKEYHGQMDGFLNAFITWVNKTADNGGTDGDIDVMLSSLYQRYQESDLDFIRSDCREMIDECLQGMDRIRSIVMDLKDFAHPGHETPEFADLNKNMDSVLNIVWNELKYKAEIVKDFGDLPPVQCHPQQLNQVFMNLLVNAAQAIEVKGKILITTRQDGDHVKVRITDNGTGIDEKHLNRIFDPFFTTKEIGKGTGLGLNLAYNIVKKHGGTISVSSVLGKGAEFTVKLPIENSKHQTDSAGNRCS